ncbi:pif1 [Symbiodinium natans]|uniref:Pif1 protein n=1 Tax=Symbiodinium natans TaxID=878477 RepID=A0A812JVD3_9DINO|nr:pif1 [Symbiodinium natans]
MTLCELSRGVAAKPLHKAQRSLLRLAPADAAHWQLWQFDFLVPAISADDWLGGCASVAQTVPGTSKGLAMIPWAEQFRTKLFSSPLPPKLLPEMGSVAFATLLCEDSTHSDRFSEWLRALDVMLWSLRRFHGVEGDDGQVRQVVPLLVLFQEEFHHEAWPLLEQRGVVPLPVGEFPAAPLPGNLHRVAAWRRLHLWSLTSFRRIVYLDTDTLVTGSLWHLFQLPDSVHFAASGFGLDHQLLRHQRLNTGVLVLSPDQEVFAAMRSVLKRGLLHDHPEFKLQGYLDQAWVDLFFRYATRRARGGLVRWRKVQAGPRNLSVTEVCPPPADAEAPREVQESPVSQLPGAGELQLNVCMLDPGSNFLVSFNAMNSCGDEVLEFCHAGLVAPKKRGIHVLHWPGRAWKPWKHEAPWSRSSADELWWSVQERVRR